MSSKEDNDQKEHKAIVGDYEVYKFDGETTLFYIEEKLQNRKWQDNDGFNGTMKMLDSRTDTPAV